MHGTGTTRDGASHDETIVKGNHTYAIRIRRVRQLDGSVSDKRSWEIAERRPRSRVIGCGTAGSMIEAKAAVDAVIAGSLEAPHPARTHRPS